MAGECKKVDVGAQVCYVRFVEGKPNHSAELSYETAPGETVIADFDADGKIVGIELVSAAGQKPRQT